MTLGRKRSDCPIHYGLQTFGDAWTLLIVRDLVFMGKTTYTDFLRSEEGIATNILADRLSRLEDDGVVSKERSGRYLLTAKGMDLLPVLLEIMRWSARHDPKTAAPPDFVRRLTKDPKGMEKEIRAGLLRAGHGRRTS